MTVRAVRKHVLFGWVSVPRPLWHAHVAALEAAPICLPFGLRIDLILLSGGQANALLKLVVPSAAPAGNGAEVTL